MCDALQVTALPSNGAKPAAQCQPSDTLIENFVALRVVPSTASVGGHHGKAHRNWDAVDPNSLIVCAVAVSS